MSNNPKAGRLVFRERTQPKWGWLSAGQPDEFPAEGQLADKAELVALLLKTFQHANLAESHLHLFDDGYYLPTTDEVLSIVRASEIAKFKPVPQRFDCDDFSFGMKAEFGRYAYENEKKLYGLCFGVAAGYFSWAGTHVACVFVNDRRKVELIEPSERQRVNLLTEGIEPQPVQKCGRCDLILV